MNVIRFAVIWTASKILEKFRFDLITELDEKSIYLEGNMSA